MLLPDTDAKPVTTSFYHSFHQMLGGRTNPFLIIGPSHAVRGNICILPRVEEIGSLTAILVPIGSGISISARQPATVDTRNGVVQDVGHDPCMGWISGASMVACIYGGAALRPAPLMKRNALTINEVNRVDFAR
jgi:hypothetical protein